MLHIAPAVHFCDRFRGCSLYSTADRLQVNTPRLSICILPQSRSQQLSAPSHCDLTVRGWTSVCCSGGAH